MNKVFIVYRNDRNGEDAIELVFLSQEGAQKYCDHMNEMTWDEPYKVLPHKVEQE